MRPLERSDFLGSLKFDVKAGISSPHHDESTQRQNELLP